MINTDSKLITTTNTVDLMNSVSKFIMELYQKYKYISTEEINIKKISANHYNVTIVSTKNEKEV